MTELDTATATLELAKYTDPAADAPIFKLDDDRVVIGMIIDIDNHLHYVVRNVDTTCEVIEAESIAYKIVEDLRLPSPKTVTVKIEQS